jgi:aryl-alcohol dehydrogenase-like predicted oxidoreductase
MIPTQQFGRTGHESTRVIFGAAAFSAVSQKDADRTMELVEQAGINHIDTAASYGESEVRLGPWLEKNRSKVFLATKTGERTRLAAYDEIQLSLERLRVDSVDLIQLHYLVDPAEWEIAMGPGGALEAAIQAKEDGLVRFIGVTGHDVPVAKMHIKSLEQYPFDSVLLPYNYPMMQNPEYARDFERLASAGGHQALHVREGVDRLAVDRNDQVAGLEARGLRGAAGLHGIDPRRGPSALDEREGFAQIPRRQRNYFPGDPHHEQQM